MKRNTDSKENVLSKKKKKKKARQWEMGVERLFRKLSSSSLCPNARELLHRKGTEDPREDWG